MPHPNQYPGQASLVYRQDSTGRFVDETEKLGLFNPDSKCMGLTVFDYDDDGDLDIFQANDHQMNYLFRNDGGGIYTEVAADAGVGGNDEGKPTGSMHGTIGDVDGDGRVDLLVVDLEHGALYRNRGNGAFEDMTRASGISQLMLGKGAWAAALFDYDNDGDLDLFSANGSGEEYILHPPLLLSNDGTGRFTNNGPDLADYFEGVRSGRGAAVWDYDNDGDLDLIVSHVDLEATPILLRNEVGNRNHWLGLDLVGSQGPASAIGATVTVTTASRTRVAINQWATAYLSHNDPRMHFGLGEDDHVDRLEIRWPDGQTEVYQDLAADRYLTIVQGKGLGKSR
jgi:hypothetical protein